MSLEVETMGNRPISVSTWVYWMGCSLAAAVGGTAYVYANFGTKQDIHDLHEEINVIRSEMRDSQADQVSRLVRIEDKVDRLNERK